RVGVRNDFSVQVRKAECERLGRIFHAGVQSRIGGLRQALRPRFSGPRRLVLNRLLETDEGYVQRAIARRRQLHDARARGVEMAQHELAITVTSRYCSCVTV